MSLDYLRDPAEIYRRSFSAIRAATDLASVPATLHALVLRIVHASGMPDIVSELRFSGDAAEAGRYALEAGARIHCDARMVGEGIMRARLPRQNTVVVTTDAPSAEARAKREATTRAAAGIALHRDMLAGSIVAIGNAPTALFRLLEEIDRGAARPALILGFPVGFIGATESKAELARDSRGVPFVTLLGRRGGSAMAAAAVNALLGNPEDTAP
jgi:precorrin-8X/cobalt-precorrin-8 methylmutase